jgi:hypothetical protein
MHVQRVCMAIAVVVCGTLYCGCRRDPRPAAAPGEAIVGETTTTSADVGPNRVAQLQRELDQTNARLAEQRELQERERQRFDKEAALRREHDIIETRIVDALERADHEVQRLRDAAAQAVTKNRRETVEKAMTDAQQQKSRLYADLRRLRDNNGQSWESFRADVDGTIRDLDHTLSTAP